MIQRIQTLFLLLAAICFGILFKLPFASMAKTADGIFSDGLFTIFDHPVMLVLTGLGAVISLASIFVFRNRSLQMRLTYLVIIISILIGVVAIFMMLNLGTELPTEATPEDETGIFIPIIAVVAAALAIRFINKDEKLVKSMDRLR